METNNFNGNMDANNDFESLEQMKQQMTMLKEKLDHQNVVNEKLILKSVKNNNNFVNRSTIIFLIIGIFALPFCTFYFYKSGFHWWFVAYTVAMLLWSIIQMIANKVKYNIEQYIDKDLVLCLDKMIRAKSAYSRQFKQSIVFIVIFMIMFYCDIILRAYAGGINKGIAICLIIGGTVGGIIGGIIGFSNNFKQRRAIDEMVEDLKEIQ